MRIRAESQNPVSFLPIQHLEMATIQFIMFTFNNYKSKTSYYFTQITHVSSELFNKNKFGRF